uniref:Integrase p58-like C-terminal domain-containing protein n=1 Tax=Cacopsylla melanoneura TaxID=428564 RepID=A0A8D8X1Z2_9HEMI
MKRGDYSVIIHGTVGKLDCDFILDTASSMSILKRDLFPDVIPTNPDKYVLRTATGEEVPVYGQVKLNTQLGSVSVIHTYLLADIVDECIMGLDFIEEHKVGILVAQRVIVLNGVKIPITLGSAGVVREPVHKHCERVKDQLVLSADVRRVTVETRPGWSNEESKKGQQVDDDDDEPVLSRKERGRSGPVLTRKERDRKPRWSDDCDGTELQEGLRNIHDKTRDKLKLSSDRMKTRYDSLCNSVGFQVGDQVWLYNPKRRKGRSPKLQQDWEGPYNVITKINDVVYRIQKGPRGKFKVVHLDRLATYLEPEFS